jgi:hypothetical protein
MRIKEGNKRSLTDAYVLDLLPPAKGEREYRKYDAKAPGLNVTVFPSGKKSYVFSYSRGRPKSLLLGHTPRSR